MLQQTAADTKKHKEAKTMAMKFRRKRGVNALRVVMKIVATILALWVGGFTYNIVADVMNGTCSPLYRGLTLVGFTIGTAECTDLGVSDANTITGTNSTSLLAVFGIIAIFWIAFEFVDLRM